MAASNSNLFQTNCGGNNTTDSDIKHSNIPLYKSTKTQNKVQESKIKCQQNKQNFDVPLQNRSGEPSQKCDKINVPTQDIRNFFKKL